MPKFRLIALVSLFVGTLAACGGGGNENGSTLELAGQFKITVPAGWSMVVPHAPAATGGGAIAAPAVSGVFGETESVAVFPAGTDEVDRAAEDWAKRFDDVAVRGRHQRNELDVVNASGSSVDRTTKGKQTISLTIIRRTSKEGATWVVMCTSRKATTTQCDAIASSFAIR